MSDTTMDSVRARQNPHEIAKNADQWRVLVNAIRRHSGDRAAAGLLAFEAGRIYALVAAKEAKEAEERQAVKDRLECARKMLEGVQ